jgi:hypothetical protein
MNQKILYILRLRAKQLFRILQDIGWILFAVFLLVSFGMFFSVGASLMKIDSWYAVPGWFTLLLLIDYGRKDKAFLVSIFQDQKSLWLHYLTEYTLMSLPILIFHSFLQNWVILWLLLIVVLLISLISLYLKKPETTFSKLSLAFIPIRFFEFKFFVESFWFSFLFLGLIGISGLLHYALFLIFIFIVVLMAPTMLTHFEAREMIVYHPFFIWKKVLNFALPMTLYVTIPLIITLLYHADMAGVVLYGVACLLVSCFLSVVLKYGVYTPVRSKFEMSNVASVLLLFMLLPGGILITLFYTLFKYNTASKNLKSLYA